MHQKEWEPPMINLKIVSARLGDRHRVAQLRPRSRRKPLTIPTSPSSPVEDRLLSRPPHPDTASAGPGTCGLTTYVRHHVKKIAVVLTFGTDNSAAAVYTTASRLKRRQPRKRELLTISWDPRRATSSLEAYFSINSLGARQDMVQC